jgi:uncharacterized lipoprotein YajG
MAVREGPLARSLRMRCCVIVLAILFLAGCATSARLRNQEGLLASALHAEEAVLVGADGQ